MAMIKKMANVDMKQVSHITAEILLIGGISYYLNSRCNVLQARVNEDREKIIAQDKRIDELEAQLSQLLAAAPQQRQAAPKPRVVFAPKPVTPKPVAPRQEPEKSVENLFFRDPAPAKSNDVESISGVFPNDDMDSLDAELRDELAELEEDA